MIFVVPIAWLVLTMVRGGMTDENGWASVLGMIGGLPAAMVGLAAALLAIDHRRPR